MANKTIYILEIEKKKNRYIHTPYGNKAVIYINNMVNKTEIGKRIINILDMASKREI